MKQLNRGNFIVWFGSFDNVAPVIKAVDVNAYMNATDALVTVNPFAGAFATYGINYDSLIVTQQDNIFNPAVYNAATRLVTYYAPAGLAEGQTRQLKFAYYDKRGNVSNEALINIQVKAMATAWRVVDSSFYCLKNNNGVNTGYSSYSLLEQYYTENGLSVNPYKSKPNTAGDPNYVAPVLNPAACPVVPRAAFSYAENPSGDQYSSDNIGIFTGAPGARVTVQCTTLTNTNGGNVYAGGYTVGINDKYEILIDATGTGRIKTRIETQNAAVGTVILAIFTIVSTSIGEVDDQHNTFQISKVF